MENYIKFLGTAGARFVMIRQLRSSAGVWYHLLGKHVLLDPGPGTLVRCAASRPRLDPTKLDAIILSHKHLDHSNDVNVMVEAMTVGGTKKRGQLFAPHDALAEDPVVLQYVRKFPRSVEILKENQQYRVGDELTFSTTIRHAHPVETYGIKFVLPALSIAHMVDTAFFPELISAYRNVDVLILHVVRLKSENDVEKGIQHLNLDDAETIIGEIRPRLAVLTHFGMTMVKARPWELAEQLQKRVGVRVMAASDGMKLDLDRL